MLRVIAERMRAAAAEDLVLREWRILADTDEIREELPEDVPLVLLQEVQVSGEVSGAPAWGCTRLRCEVQVSMTVGQGEGKTGNKAVSLAVLRDVLYGVLRELRRVEVQGADGRWFFSVSAWPEAAEPVSYEGAEQVWKMPFVWVVCKD